MILLLVMDQELKYWIGFSVFPGIGPVRFKLLYNYFGSAKAAWNASGDLLEKIKLGGKLTSEFVDFRKKFNFDEYCSRLAKLHVSVIAINDPKYPVLLKEVDDAPFLLYVKGSPSADSTGRKQKIDLKRTIAVVGTRKITPYGVEVTRRLVGELVACGFTIVSGMAYGVDAVAHQAAIDAGGKTIAVLGCGVDVIAPPSNTKLYFDIADGRGVILSEMPLGHQPTKGLFPARNRIISGLSLGVVVTEGAEDSGALITARNAAEQGREVFAVPGPITSTYSHGPAKLLKNGAKLVESVDDILEELHISKISSKDSTGNTRILGETKEEQKVLDCLMDRRVHIDDLVRASGLTIQVATATITILQMRGVIREYGEREYGL